MVGLMVIVGPIVVAIKPGVLIDYGCEDRKAVGKLRDYIGVIRYVLTLSLRKSRSSLQKHEPFIQEIHLKKPLLSNGLKLSNSKPSCRVSALCFSVK
jgi:hypothetical protein